MFLPVARSHDARACPAKGWFTTTHWSVVLAAGGKDAAQSLEALESLCSAYWYPLYAYVRRRGHGPADAQDLTQEFFARLLEKNWLADLEPEGGRFRSFLLTAMNRFLANEYDRSRSLKRGGGRVPVSLDRDETEGRYACEPATDETPERIFEKGWALTVLDQALARLGQELEADGKGRYFERLSPFLSREADPGEYAKIGGQWGMSAGAVGVAVHRLRQRYRESVRQEIARTVADPAQVDAEMRHLLEALQG